MDLSIILMIVGILLIIVSFFFKNNAKKVEQDVEELSISIFQETNNLKRRLKIVEEELLLEPEFQVKSNSVQNNMPDPKVQQVIQAVQQAAQASKAGQGAPQTKNIHQIIVSQVLELNKQGLSVADISIRSNLSEEQVRQVIANGGR
ncbi:hypothetical protein [Lysinibacillus xylanilyticus]|uniref:hypothetical protein n=1 Tax=Lysinibacillus xylanilyticus TaxID=582475 RepID=UPI00083C927F|nr:hypothetical protein [Lysinibacillus xylanilyticus]